MIKKYIGAAVSLIILMVPAGLALADDGGDSHTVSSDASAAAQVHLQNSAGEDVNENDGTEVDTSEGQGDNGSSTMPWSNGEKNGLLKHFGTTTPPGIARHEEGSSSEDNASSTNENQGDGGDHQDSGVQGNNPFTSFWHWIFGLPATTTVGDIRTAVTASTTASTTAPAPEGFFQKFLHFFHFGSND